MKMGLLSIQFDKWINGILHYKRESEQWKHMLRTTTGGSV